MKNELVMKYPASWHQAMWREGAPFGNGIVGGMVYGGVYKERILLNHAFLWRGGKTDVLPDISDEIPEIRSLLKRHKVQMADVMLSKKLKSSGYEGENMTPASLCDLTFETPPSHLFSQYRRVIRMDCGEVTVSWKEGDVNFSRSTFASRDNELIFTRFQCGNGHIHTRIALERHDDETGDSGEIAPNTGYKQNRLYFSTMHETVYKSGHCGAVSKIFTDGSLKFSKQGAEVCDATEILVVTGTFVGMEWNRGFHMLEKKLARDFDYDEELAKHTVIHKPLFEKVQFSISEGEKQHSNEELLLDAYEEKASSELVEKLYAYGRYLFLCSTAEEGSLPCHLTGLFHGDAYTKWAFHMFNINFQMIYWHTLSGNLPGFLRSALDYIEAFVPDFQENARKLFGCRGIWINSVNTPESGLSKCMENHILNWTGAAAWISQHFWDYYRYTLDVEYLKGHALPFMYEAALFYEDFVEEAEDGYYDLYPSVSPENVAQNIRDNTPPEVNVETSVNATMETALLKELLTNLLQGAEIAGMYEEKWETWKLMLTKLRPYQVNEDGALKEWQDDYYKDNYRHRHHSHLYPVFPGREITKEHPLYSAAVKAEDMRLSYGFCDQSGWSLLMMAGIATRMERGDLALELISTLSRTCMMNNFLALHNDWRRMGPACCGDLRSAPFQIDGNIGIPAIIHDMLVQGHDERIEILPALPKEWKQGSIKGVLLPGNILCDLKWQEETLEITLRVQKGRMERTVCLNARYQFEDGLAKKQLVIDDKVILRAVRKH